METPSIPKKKKKKKRGRRFSPRKAARLFLPAVLIVILISIFSGGDKTHAEAIDEEEELVEDNGPRYDIPSADDDIDYTKCLEKMPEPTVKMKVNYFGNPRQVFNDSNYVHLAEAMQIGIEPLSDVRSHWQVRKPLVKVTSCEDYFIDKLTYSRPYLIPEAELSLREIGHRFRDTIAARGGGDYRIKVTSLLRTPATVKKLRRHNSNAVDSSVHQYATTFDISYAAFIADSDTLPRSIDDLKGVLSEVLKAMREEGKIWVKYERKQPCFHITARRRNS
ncbi:MAG: DUF5715 family protein [Lachnoclostridium sp.]|nr:DUF5715 family protein [Lachnoclostridium sp.]